MEPLRPSRSPLFHNKHRYQRIGVHQVAAGDGRSYNVLYLATGTGTRPRGRSQPAVCPSGEERAAKISGTAEHSQLGCVGGSGQRPRHGGGGRNPSQRATPSFSGVSSPLPSLGCSSSLLSLGCSSSLPSLGSSSSFTSHPWNLPHPSLPSLGSSHPSPTILRICFLIPLILGICFPIPPILGIVSPLTSHPWDLPHPSPPILGICFLILSHPWNVPHPLPSLGVCSLVLTEEQKSLTEIRE